MFGLRKRKQKKLLPSEVEVYHGSATTKTPTEIVETRNLGGLERPGMSIVSSAFKEGRSRVRVGSFSFWRTGSGRENSEVLATSLLGRLRTRI